MADFGGFQIETPQEVLAKLQAQQQAIQQLPPRQARNANIQFQIANMFGNPELEKAKLVESRMQAVNEAAPPSTDLVGEKKRLSMMFDAVKSTDPLAAAQISQQLTAIDNEIFERDRLTQSARRSDRAVDIQQRQIALQEERFGRLPDFSGFGYVIDPNDPKSVPQQFDLNDPEQNAQYMEAARKGMTVMSHDQAIEALGRNAVDAMKADAFNKSAFNKKTQGYTAQSQFLKQGKRLVDRFVKNPDAGSLVLDVTRGISNLAAEGKALARTLEAKDGSSFNEDNTKGYIRQRLDEMEKSGTLKIGQIDRSLYESAILNMGYVLARSLDSGGRLSDQDVNMAIKMLTGGSLFFEDGTISVPADQIVSVMLERANDINNMLSLDSPDEILFSADDAAGGNQQAIKIRGLRELNRQLFGQFRDSARNKLGEEEFQRVTNPGEGLTDAEALEVREAEARQAEVARRAANAQQAIDAEELAAQIPSNDPPSEEEQVELLTLVSMALQKKKLTPEQIKRIKDAGLWNAVNK